MPDSDGIQIFRFEVAFSFAGPHREKVRTIAKLVQAKLGREKVFFDEWFEDELGGDNADSELQRIYVKETLMVVADVSDAYSDRPWCQAEATAIRAFRMTLDTSRDRTQRKRLAYIRFDDGEVSGVLANAIVWDQRRKTEKEIAKLILTRLKKLKEELETGKPIDSKPSGRPDPAPVISKLWKSIGLGCLLVGILMSMFWFQQDRSPSNTFRILVADIDGPNKGLTGSLIEKLRNETRNYADIIILPLNDKITAQDGPEKASELALKQNADLVIWGRNPDLSDYVEVKFHLRSPQIQGVMPATQARTFIFSAESIGIFAVQDIISDGTGSLALLVVAYREFFRGRNTEALRFLKRAIELSPDKNDAHMGAAHFASGEILRILNKFDEAETHYTKSIQINSNFAYSFMGRGISHFNRSHLQEAVKDCTSAIQLHPQLADAYNIRGDAYFQIGDITNALSDHKKYLSFKPDDAPALVRRGMLYAKVGDFSSALADLKAAEKISKDSNLQTSIGSMLDTIERILIRGDSMSRTIIGFEWLTKDSNNQTRTNYASGVLLTGTKAVYAVTSANVARQIHTNGLLLICSASNTLSKISLAELGERSRFSVYFPLWFFEPQGGDCAALPFLLGHTTGLPNEKAKLLNYIAPIPLPNPAIDTNEYMPSVGDTVTLTGIGASLTRDDGFRIAEFQSSVQSGLLSDSRGNSFFLVNEDSQENFEGGPVFESLKTSIDMQMNRIVIDAKLKAATSLGIVAKPSGSQIPEKRARVIYRRQILEFIQGLENTINISWDTNNASKKAI